MQKGFNSIVSDESEEYEEDGFNPDDLEDSDNIWLIFFPQKALGLSGFIFYL